MPSAIFTRLRAIACREWKIAPPQFDEWVGEGRISYLDVMELVKVLCHDPLTALWIYDYLYPERVAEEAARKKREAEAEEKRKREERWRIDGLRLLGMVSRQHPENEKLKAWTQQLAKDEPTE